jgi:dihydropteroate synthase
MHDFGGHEFSRRALLAPMSGRPLLMAIINATPDSFHKSSRDGGIEEGISHFAAGADWVDIGGESTRPGSLPITIEEELARVIPLVEELSKHGPISIDTRNHQVAKAAIDAGAKMINDVSGLRDPLMFDLVLQSGVAVCIMHMQNTPEEMQKSPHYDDVCQQVSTELLKTARRLVAAGHPRELICLDPGIGFGKELTHNIELLQGFESLRGTEGFSLLWGVSRKTMIGQICDQDDSEDRLAGSLGVAAYAQLKGIDILRVHDVREHADLAAVMSRLLEVEK